MSQTHWPVLLISKKEVFITLIINWAQRDPREKHLHWIFGAEVSNPSLWCDSRWVHQQQSGCLTRRPRLARISRARFASSFELQSVTLAAAALELPWVQSPLLRPVPRLQLSCTLRQSSWPSSQLEIHLPFLPQHQDTHPGAALDFFNPGLSPESQIQARNTQQGNLHQAIHPAAARTSSSQRNSRGGSSQRANGWSRSDPDEWHPECAAYSQQLL